MARPDFYEETVVTYMETKGVDRLEAQRRMDFMFNDPNGFGVNELREEQMGEKINYNIKSGVQNRPVFSAFWAAWCFYFFFIFLPARVTELGGIDFTPPSSTSWGPTTKFTLIKSAGPRSYSRRGLARVRRGPLQRVVRGRPRGYLKTAFSPLLSGTRSTPKEDGAASR